MICVLPLTYWRRSKSHILLSSQLGRPVLVATVPSLTATPAVAINMPILAKTDARFYIVALPTPPLVSCIGA